MIKLLEKRRVIGIMLLSFVCICSFDKDFCNFFVVRDTDLESCWWGVWTNACFYLFGLFCILFGGYCFIAGDMHLPEYDDGDYRINWETLTKVYGDSKGSGSGVLNKNIAGVLAYRNSKMSMMTNDKALGEFSKTAGLDTWVNSSHSSARYLNSQLSMRSNSDGYAYVSNLMSRK